MTNPTPKVFFLLDMPMAERETEKFFRGATSGDAIESGDARYLPPIRRWLMSMDAAVNHDHFDELLTKCPPDMVVEFDRIDADSVSALCDEIEAQLERQIDIKRTEVAAYSTSVTSAEKAINDLSFVQRKLARDRREHGGKSAKVGDSVVVEETTVVKKNTAE